MGIKNYFSFKKEYLVIVRSVILGFCLLILLAWMNEILDLPFYLFGGQKTILNWQEMLIETIFLVIVGFITLKSMFKQFLVCNSIEGKLERFNRVLLLIMQINQDILWIKSKQQLCDLICSGFVKYDYKFVWIGFCDEEIKRIVPQAQAGFEDGYLEEINISYGQDKSNLAPEVMAVKLKRSSVRRFIAKGTNYAFWSKQALSRGYMSLAVIPIFMSDKVIGVLNFYSEKEDAFEDKEVNLLEDFAHDVSISLKYVDNEIERVNLEEEKNKLLKTLEASTDAIDIATPEGLIKYTNKAMEELFGYGNRELIGRNINILNVNQEVDGGGEGIISALREKGCWEGDILNKRKDETEFISHTKVAAYRDKEEKIISIIAIYRDITERKRMENLLKDRKEWLEKAVKERTDELMKVQIELDAAKRLSDLGKFGATIAHELRNPLGVIRMAVYNLKQKVKNADIKRHLDSIDKKVTESDLIIKNILGYSCLKPPVFEKISCKEVVTECLISISSKYNELKAQVKVDFNRGEGGFIYADRIQMIELFSNIMDNAFQALSCKHGTIECKGDYQREKNILKVVFKDSGIGIDPEDLNRIYEPFFTKKVRGIGLGLSLCRQIVLFHGGSLEINSIKDQGTEVVVSLPVTRENKDKGIDK